LQVLLLRIRLVGIRCLLRAVVALRHFVRRRRGGHGSPAVRPVGDPGDRCWVPVGSRSVLALPMVGAVCFTAAFMVGRGHNADNWSLTRQGEVASRSDRARPLHERKKGVRETDGHAREAAETSTPSTFQQRELPTSLVVQRHGSGPSKSPEVRDYKDLRKYMLRH
jgi:hypothetical protein